MTLEIEKLLDDTGWAMLRELQEDARLSYSELGRRVGLSSPAVVDRMRRMEEVGIITGYRTEVNLAKLGYSIQAFVRVASMMGENPSVASMYERSPEVLECHRVTGSDDYILKVAVASIQHLEDLLNRFSRNQITTLIVLSSPVTRRTIGHPPQVGD